MSARRGVTWRHPAWRVTTTNVALMASGGDGGVGVAWPRGGIGVSPWLGRLRHGGIFAGALRRRISNVMARSIAGGVTMLLWHGGIMGGMRRVSAGMYVAPAAHRNGVCVAGNVAALDVTWRVASWRRGV